MTTMREIEFYPGVDIEEAWYMLQDESRHHKDICSGLFNGKRLLSTDSLDEAYVKVLGKTKAEYDKEMQDWKNEHERREKEFKESIPELIPKFRKMARGVILEDRYGLWDKIVPIRLGDLYHGMELNNTIALCKIMRDESVDYDKRLRMAYDEFMNQGHSGMSAHLVASMVREFCPNGDDLANAVLNFRFS